MGFFKWHHGSEKAAKGPMIVSINFSYSKFHDTTDSINEIPEVGVQLMEWLVTLCLHAWQYVQVGGNGCTHGHLLTQRLVQLSGLAEERQQSSLQTNKNLKQEWLLAF